MIRPAKCSLIAGLLCVAAVTAMWAQSRALPSGDVHAIYQRLLPQIERIKAFDHHAHPAWGDDPDVDAQATPPGQHLPLRARETNPEFALAMKALFGYPYSDMSAEHARWLIDRSNAAEKAGGVAYWDGILDKCGIDVSLANRVALGNYLDPKRFRWVFFVDCFLFPFDNKLVTGENPDEGVFIPLQEKLLRRYMKQEGIDRLPESFDAYLAFVTRVLEYNQKKGGIAEKFEVAYFRSLYFADPPRAAAAGVYQKYRAQGVPTPGEYRTFQDYVFRFLVREGGRLHLPVHLHTAIGEGDYFSLQKGNVVNLENVVKDPRYLDTTFVLLHGGYPYYQQIIWLAYLMKVFFDCSDVVFIVFHSVF